MKHFLYAETAFHHEGDFQYMMELVNQAANNGADGIKFQVLLDYDSLIAKSNPAYNDFKRALFSKEEWLRIFEHARTRKLKVVFMPCDAASMRLIQEKVFIPDFLDLHSVSFYDLEILLRIKETGIPLILGIGGRYLQEIDEKMSYFDKQIYCLMLGFQAFPTNLKDVKLEKIALLKRLYPDVRIGYADHSHFEDESGVVANIAALALGANVFEKHLTLTEGVERFDFISSVSPEKFKRISEMLSLADHPNKWNGAKEELFTLDKTELAYRNRQKVAVAAQDIHKGVKLKKEHIAFKMVGNVDGFADLAMLIGREIKEEILCDYPIMEKHLTS